MELRDLDDILSEWDFGINTPPKTEDAIMKALNALENRFVKDSVLVSAHRSYLSLN